MHISVFINESIICYLFIKIHIFQINEEMYIYIYNVVIVMFMLVESFHPGT